MTNNSDYFKPRTNLFDLLPTVYKSDTNKSILENLFNRFLTKDETIPVSGYIGEGNRNALLNRRIPEETVHRQAFQLQPIIQEKVGTVEYINSWYDILKEIARHGISNERINEWGDAKTFNWVPPIDLDKLINYKDYFWYDSGSTISRPEYVTVKSPCATATSKVSLYKLMARQFGLTQEIIDVRPAQNEVIIPFDKTMLFEPNFVFYVENSPNSDLNEKYHIVVSSVFNREKNQTHVVISTNITQTTFGGQITLQPLINQATFEANCACHHSYGWDVQSWDDGQISNNIWTTHYIQKISQPTESDWQTNNAPYDVGSLWWNTTENNVYSLVNSTTFEWKLLYTGEVFNQILQKITGTEGWDYSTSCHNEPKNESIDQWSRTNKWLHRMDVPNFARAKQAVFPIIEFEYDIEINEWTYTDFVWKYRSALDLKFEQTVSKPTMFELMPVDAYIINGNTLIFHEKFGDLTNVFVDDYAFFIEGTSGLHKVVSADYKVRTVNGPWQTSITITDFENTPGYTVPSTLIPQVNYLRPVKTSKGDPFVKYHAHWVMVGNAETLATGHCPTNPKATFDEANILAHGVVLDQSYEYFVTQFSEKCIIKKDNVTEIELGKVVNSFGFEEILLPPGVTGLSKRTLQQRALVGFNDICVYINGVRQYGTYDELEKDENIIDHPSGRTIPVSFVKGIRFHRNLVSGDEVVIEVGENSPEDFGRYYVPVRMTESDTDYSYLGPTVTSLIRYRKTEQTKTDPIQAPLFDLYRVTGQSAYLANEIFKYREDDTANLNVVVGKRVFVREDKDPEFENMLVETNNGKMYAYRNYARPTTDYWFDTKGQKVLIWTGVCWSEKYETSDGYYLSPIVRNNLPQGSQLDQLIVFDTFDQKLYQYDDDFSTWNELTSVTIADVDPTLQTIWRDGTDHYTPSKVDWYKRTRAEYETERLSYINKRVVENTDSSLTPEEKVTQAENQWNVEVIQQINPNWFSNDSYVESPEGTLWIGNWEIPDPLYYNCLHENRKFVSARELERHFSTIMDAQEKIPGYQGTKRYMFHVLKTSEIDFSLGGTIKEYDNSFDTFLSSAFVNNVTPIGLFAFAQEQYESALLSLKEDIRANSLEYLTDLSEYAITDLKEYVIQQVINNYETNDTANLIFGDTTAFKDGTPDMGVRNWIVTLPFLNLASSIRPVVLKDELRGIDAISHHDGHLNVYGFPRATTTQLSTKVVDQWDMRVLDSRGRSTEKIGRVRTTQPPNTLQEFLAQFSTVFRNAVYWYNKNEDNLYRFVAAIGDNPPPANSLYKLWFDTTENLEVLRLKIGDVWTDISGLSPGDQRFHNGSDPFDLTTGDISAWQLVDFNDLSLSAVLEVEERLFEYSSEFQTKPTLDYEALRQENPQLFEQYLKIAFADFIKQSEISNPFLNLNFSSSNPFTWNYKYTVPGTRANLLEINVGTNEFVVEGSIPGSYAPGTHFFIKNGGSNDGKWEVSSVTYEANTTRIVPTTTILADAPIGILYTGATLPSQQNTGAESGGDWKDVYQKFFGTSFPHLEPWKLQHYTSKPTWWDAWYANDNLDTYGSRRWKYLHQMRVINVDPSTNVLTILGDFSGGFNDFPRCTLHTQSAKFNLPCSGAYTTVQDIPTLGIVDVTIVQISSSVPSITLTGNEFVSVGMWDYILRGVIPPGEAYPNEIVSVTGDPSNDFTVDNVYPIPKFSFVCVNISDGILDDGYGEIPPDGIFAPYWNRHSALGVNATLNVLSSVRSLYYDAISPGADFTWNDAGPIEWFWRNSSHYLYSLLATAYRIDPVRTIQQTFGIDFAYIDGLPIDRRKEMVFAHNITDFHGDIGTDNLPVIINGINQWYVNYNRFNGFDTNFSNFRSLWTGWTAPLTYQFNSLLDTTSLFVDHRNLQISSFDFETTLKRSPGVANYWINALTAKIVSVPPNIIQYDNENEWILELDAISPTTVPVEYYDVRLYDFATFTEGINIIGTNPDERQIMVNGNYTWLFKEKTNFFIKQSSNSDLDETYQNVESSSYDIGSGTTVIKIKNTFVDSTADGIVSVSTCSLFTYPIIGVDVQTNSIFVEGDVSDVFNPLHGATTISVRGSVGLVPALNNDREFNVRFAIFNPHSNVTTITTAQPVHATTDNGFLKVEKGIDGETPYRVLPWVTGDPVVVSSTEILPIPLTNDKTYFIIVLSPTEFQFAYTQRDASVNIPLILSTVGYGIQRVGQLQNTFFALNGKTCRSQWRHYAVDTTSIKAFVAPTSISGMQTLINIVDGYAKYTYDLGFRINENALYSDYDTGRIKTWDVDVERFIDWAHQQRVVRRQTISDRYAVTVDYNNDTFDFSSQIPPLRTSDEVVVWATEGGLPSPLERNTTYYAIVVDNSKIRLAASRTDAKRNIWIDIQNTGGVGKLAIARALRLRGDFPVFEINPFRDGIWFNHPYGIVSNVIVGPHEDILSQQLLIDQYKRKLSPEQLRVFREDNLTQIQIAQDMINTVDSIQTEMRDPYNFIHLSGANLFLDTFEHILFFHDYTTEQGLIYDPFFGINATKFELDFNRSAVVTRRPSVGGHYMTNYYNQGADLNRNWEASADDMRLFYDTYVVPETIPAMKHSRALLGYEGMRQYLSDINVNAKSQFLFWKGMIQNKGSLNAIKAFINSKRFIDAKVDEYWAVKIAEFGSAKEQEYVSMWLKIEDSKANDFRVDFVNDLERCRPGYAVNPYDNYCGYAYPTTADSRSTVLVDGSFIPVYSNDTSRWYEYPDQAQRLYDQGGSMYFTMKPVDKIKVSFDPLFIPGVSSTYPETYDDSTGIINFSTGVYSFYRWNTEQNQWILNGWWGPGLSNELPLLRHSGKSDLTKLLVKWRNDGFVFAKQITAGDLDPTDSTGKTIVIPSFIPLTGSLEVLVDNQPLVNNVGYYEVIDDTLISTKIVFVDSVVGKLVEIAYKVGTLVVDLHFEEVNSNIIRLFNNDFIVGDGTNDTPQLTIWPQRVDYDSQNPAKIIDIESNVVMSPVQMWDPDRGHHFYRADHVIDIKTSKDPAYYNISLEPSYPVPYLSQPEYPDTSVPVYRTGDSPWNQRQVGTVWMDTQTVDYLPYYDPKAMDDEELRLRSWGSLSAWGEVHLYQWTESDIVPDLWDDVAAVEQTNNSIDPQVKKSGTAKKFIYYKKRQHHRFTVNLDTSTINILGPHPHTYEVGNLVCFFPVDQDVDILPPEVEVGQEYKILSVTGSVIELEILPFTTTGTGLLTVADIGFITEENLDILDKIVRQDFDPLIDGTFVGSTPDESLYRLVIDHTLFDLDDEVNVYVNGELNRQIVLVQEASYTLNIAVQPTDHVTVVRLLHEFTEADLTVDALNESIFKSYQSFYNYTSVEFRDEISNTVKNKYYFWVENKTTAQNGKTTIFDAAEELVVTPEPYMFFRSPRSATSFTNSATGEVFNLPDRFTQMVIRSLRGIINDENRYILRFTRDYSLRDRLENGETPLEQKNNHAEWLMIRREQPSIIPKQLWDRITEAIIGYKINNPTIRVPTLDRELYDEQNGTDTRFGLGEQQAFVDGSTALNTIQQYLNDPNNEFFPVSIDLFFANNSFDSGSDIIKAMNAIYNSFHSQHVNNMYFEVLHDAFVFKSKYSEIFKTSMVALHGIRLLEVQGIYDD